LRETVKARPVVSYAVARVATAVLTGGAFFMILGVIGLGIAGALTKDVLQLKHARFMMAVGIALTAFFAGHSGSIGLLDGFSQGRFRLPDAAMLPPTAARARNPWHAALWSTLLLGAPLALVAFWLLPEVWPSGVSRGRFVGCFAVLGSFVSVVIVWVLTGRAFLSEASLPLERRSFQGSHAAYLWQRHALPQGLANLLINGWVGVALVPAAMSSPSAEVPAALVLADAGGTAFVLAIAIAIGVHTYARFDLRWGVIPAIPVSPPRAFVRLAALFGSAFVVAFLVRALYAGLGLDAISGWTFVVWRSLLCGLYCGAVGYWIARWSLCVPGATISLQPTAAETSVQR
jgi:hypothetical protein